MYICENCNKEFSKGLDLNSKRFCCKHCRRVWIGKTSARHRKEKGTFYTPFGDEKARKKFNYSNSKTKRAPYGTWKCLHCDYIAETRAKLKTHTHEQHSEFYGKSCWNKGLTAETHPSVKRGATKLKSRYASGEIVGSQKGRPHTQEEKDKISKTLSNFYKQHPDLVPFKLNHSSKKSYPELYFEELFSAENIVNFKRELYVSGYFLDFAFETKKIDLEIDGSQHYKNGKLKDRDIRRNEKLESLGWKVIRVNWSEWKKLSDQQRKDWISDFKNILKK
jgi:very-short-patch-repair endonuclease